MPLSCYESHLTVAENILYPSKKMQNNKYIQLVSSWIFRAARGQEHVLCFSSFLLMEALNETKYVLQLTQS